MKLKYFVPFKAEAGDLGLALKEKLLNIEGIAIDSSVNSNKWQVPEEDLDFFVSSLQGSQLRIDHAESAMAVIGKVPEAKRVGTAVWFRAEIGELPIIEKVARGYLTHVSVQVDSDDVECSKCHQPSREQGLLKHLCPGAWEIVHKPKVRELSIVASPAYKNTEFHPVGFAAAMNESQGRYNDADKVMKRVKDLIQKIRETKEAEDTANLECLVARLTKVADDLLRLPKQETEATRENLKWRLQKLKADLARLPRDKPRTVRDEMIVAWQASDKSHTAAQLDKLFESNITDFSDYFTDPECMAALKRLSMT